ncbi:hypothetical protein FJ251_13925 [bacterium]|nr:hypothetical protein [bacterium]
MHRLVGLAVVSLLAAALAAAESAGALAAGDGELLLRGTLSTRARIALPPEAIAFLELRAGAPETGTLIVEQRWATAGRQVPLAFALALPHALLAGAGPLALRGGILVAGRPAWISEPVALAAEAPGADLGALDLAPAPPGAFAVVFRCGERRVAVGYNARELLLAIDEERFPLRQTIAASGARYVARADSTIELWNKGEDFMVTLRGERLPDCGAVPADR